MSHLPIKLLTNDVAHLSQSIAITTSLVQRNISANEEIYFRFMCGKQAFIDERYKAALNEFNYVINYFESNPGQQVVIKNGRITPMDEFLNSFQMIGNIHFKLRDYESAINYYSRCIGYDSNSIAALMNMSTALMYLDRFNEALTNLSRIIRLKEFCPEELRYMGICYTKLNDDRKAIVFFKKSAELGDKESKKILEDNNL